MEQRIGCPLGILSVGGYILPDGNGKLRSAATPLFTLTAMITKPTLFVLGAGASKPYGFPVAKELKSDICDNISRGENTWKDRIEHLSPSYLGKPNAQTDLLSWKRAEQFGKDFRLSPITSIDEFLENRREYRLVGKASIALSLIPNEIRRKLLDDTDEWYTWLFNRMVEGLGSEQEIPKNKVKIITFNYDRSFEEFFISSLIRAYGIDDREHAIELFEESFDMTHAYGKLGSLTGENKRDYNDSLSHEPLTTAINGIELIYEVKSSQKRNKLTDYIKTSERIIFMGFGYHEENLEILSLDKVNTSKKTFYGTAKGLREFDRGRVNKLFDRFDINITLGRNDFGCSEFLERTKAML